MNEPEAPAVALNALFGSWMPIETAPKDGRHILLYRSEIQFVGYYGGANSGWRINAPGLPAVWPLPTHWMPIPHPPNPSHHAEPRFGGDSVDGVVLPPDSDALLGPKHTGMRVSCSGLLGRLAHGGRCAKGERYMLGELLKHLEHVGREYYAGNVTFVDEFLQCYCLDDHRPNVEISGGASQPSAGS